MGAVEVSLEIGASIVALAGVLGGLWGGLVSVRAATRGPQWALDHLRTAFPVAVTLLIASVAVMVLIRPAWVGVGLIYVSGVVAWMARSVARSLERVRAAGAFGSLPPDRQSAILSRTSRWLLVGGGVIVLVFVFDYLWRGWPALFDLLLAAALLVPGWRIRHQAGNL